MDWRPASATSQQVRADVGLGDSAGGPAVPIGGLPTIQRARRPIRSAATPSISSCPASLHIILLPACSPTPQAWELVGPVSTSAAAVPRPPHSTTSSETPTGKIQAAWQHFARPNLLPPARPDCASLAETYDRPRCGIDITGRAGKKCAALGRKTCPRGTSRQPPSSCIAQPIAKPVLTDPS